MKIRIKKLLKLALITGVFCSIQVSKLQAQYAFGLNVAGRILTKSDPSFRVIGLTADFIKKKYFYHSSVGLGFSDPEEYNITVYALDQYTNPSLLNLKYETKSSAILGEFGIGKVFNSDYDEGGFFITASVDLMAVSFKSELRELYDKTKYALDESMFGNKKWVYGLQLKLSGGYMYVFGPFGLSVSAGFSSGISTNKNTPLNYLEIRAGITYYLF